MKRTLHIFRDTTGTMGPMRRKLQAGGRSVLGTQPLLALFIVGVALATAALEDAGFDEWWALPAALVALLLGTGVRRDR